MKKRLLKVLASLLALGLFTFLYNFTKKEAAYSKNNYILVKPGETDKMPKANYSDDRVKFMPIPPHDPNKPVYILQLPNQPETL